MFTPEYPASRLKQPCTFAFSLCLQCLMLAVLCYFLAAQWHGPFLRSDHQRPESLTPIYFSPEMPRAAASAPSANALSKTSKVDVPAPKLAEPPADAVQSAAADETAEVNPP